MLGQVQVCTERLWACRSILTFAALHWLHAALHLMEVFLVRDFVLEDMRRLRVISYSAWQQISLVPCRKSQKIIEKKCPIDSNLPSGNKSRRCASEALSWGDGVTIGSHGEFIRPVPHARLSIPHTFIYTACACAYGRLAEHLQQNCPPIRGNVCFRVAENQQLHALSFTWKSCIVSAWSIQSQKLRSLHERLLKDSKRTPLSLKLSLKLSAICYTLLYIGTDE